MENQTLSNSPGRVEDGPLVAALIRLLGESGVLTGDRISAGYSSDWGRDRTGQARAVVRPRTSAEVAEICRIASRAGIGIVPQGGHTGLVAGAQHPGGDCILLSTERLNRIEEIDADNLTCTVQAGVVLEALQSALDAQDLQFGVSIGSQGSAQIGGLISTNAGGVRVVRHGMIAAHVLGLEMVLADGRVTSSISGLHKDNRGPDPLRLAIGGEGAFGIVTRACLRIAPLKRYAATAYLGCASFEDALGLLRHLRRDAHEVLSAFEVMSEACPPLALLIDPKLTPPVTAPVHVLVHFAATMSLSLAEMLETHLATALEAGLATDAVIAQSEAQAARFWAIREGLVEGHSRRGYHVRSDVSVRLGRVPEAAAALEAMLAAEFPDWTAQTYGHMGDGNLHFNALPPEGMAEETARATGRTIETRIFEIVLGLDGSFSAEHGIGRTKTDWFRKTLPDRHAILAGIKNVLDPAGIMNPGCLLTTSAEAP